MTPVGDHAGTTRVAAKWPLTRYGTTPATEVVPGQHHRQTPETGSDQARDHLGDHRGPPARVAGDQPRSPSGPGWAPPHATSDPGPAGDHPNRRTTFP